MQINITEINVKIKFIEEKKLKAIISLDFGDFTVKGFRIQESQYENIKGDKLWFTPPTYYAGGRHHPIFFVPNKDLWKKLELKVWDEYKKQSVEHYAKKFDLKDEDIPIIQS